MTTTTPRSRAKGTVTVVPQDAKQPQDRKPKAADAELTEEQRVAMHAESAVVVREDGLTRITLDGFTIEVPDDAQDDFELLAAVAQLDDAHARGSVNQMLVHFPEVLRRLAGESGWRTVMNGLRGENERVKVRPAIDYLNAILYILRIGAEEE
jgi:hypothetical protein